MTSKERIIKAFKCQSVDRVPIFTSMLDEWVEDNPRSKHRSYERLLAYARENADAYYFAGPTSPDEKIFFTATDKIEVKKKKYRINEGEVTETIVETPRGSIKEKTFKPDNLLTTWKEDSFIKSKEDLEAVLSIPYKPPTLDFNPVIKEIKRLGGRGCLHYCIITPMAMASNLFSYPYFMETIIEKPSQIQKLVEYFYIPLGDRIKDVLKSRLIPVIYFAGDEYVAPPHMNPLWFKKIGMPYEKELVEMVHAAGAIAHVHCHGRVKDILPMYIEMEMDAIDPVEPPPDGDMEITEAKVLLKDKMCIIGNIEYRLLEFLSRQEIDSLVKEVMEIGKKDYGFILMPTARPDNVPLTTKQEENFIQFIESGRKYGRY